MLGFLNDNFENKTKPFVIKLTTVIHTKYMNEIASASKITNKHETAFFKTLQLYKASQDYKTLVSELFDASNANGFHFRAALILFDFIRKEELGYAANAKIGRAHV